MEGNVILLVICGAVMLVGGLETVYQIYSMVLVDAKARGLKHPRLWGIFAMSGNNSSGLIMYLVGRRRYPILHISEQEKGELDKRKKSAGVGIVFMAAGTIGMIINMMCFM